MALFVENQVQEIEISIEQAKHLISNKDALSRLINNADFKKIITEGYFEKEASRLVLLKADQTMQDDKDQALLLKAIDSVGFFRQYSSEIMRLGRQDEKDLKDAEEVREEILRENV